MFGVYIFIEGNKDVFPYILITGDPEKVNEYWKLYNIRNLDKKGYTFRVIAGGKEIFCNNPTM